MNRGEVKALRRAMRDREGELRGVAVDRLRHAMRRACRALERDRREALA